MVGIENFRCKNLGDDLSGFVVLTDPAEGTSKFAKTQILKSAVEKNKKRIRISSKPLIFQGDPNDVSIMEMAFQVGQESTCWFRQVGCVIARNGEILIVGSNQNVYNTDCKNLGIDPSEIKLNPRETLNFCNAIHAERVTVARAARNGIKIEGSIVYVTTCPCDECAKVLVEAGIAKVVYSSDYYNKDGIALLEMNNISVTRIKNA